jgi:hypothetical protein
VALSREAALYRQLGVAVIDYDTWLTLAERCHTIRTLHQQQKDEPRIVLVYDDHDQARVIKLPSRSPGIVAHS